MVNYYTELELTEEATPAQIKAAFKKLALKYHPDKTEGDIAKEERFKEINKAYQILSDPFEKASYDLQLKYGHIADETFYSPPPPKNRYKEPKIDWKENWIATAYAFAFTFLMAAIVMSGIKVKNYLDSLEMEALLKERRERFEAARSLYKLGNVDIALKKINDLGAFMETEADMEQYKKQLYHSFLYKGENSFKSGEYKDAIYYYELIEKFDSRKPLPLKEQLALAYKNTNQPHKSVKKLKEILIGGYRHMEIFILLAEIHSDMLNEKEEAKRYLEIANEIATKNYKSVYGEAYPLFLTGHILPRAHYVLYEKLAKVYFETGEYEKAIKATRWNTHIWPDSVSNYVIAAKGYAAIGDWKKACESSKHARTLGYKDSDIIQCQ